MNLSPSERVQERYSDFLEEPNIKRELFKQARYLLPTGIVLALAGTAFYYVNGSIWMLGEFTGETAVQLFSVIFLYTGIGIPLGQLIGGTVTYLFASPASNLEYREAIGAAIIGGNLGYSSQMHKLISENTELTETAASVTSLAGTLAYYLLLGTVILLTI